MFSLAGFHVFPGDATDLGFHVFPRRVSCFPRGFHIFVEHVAGRNLENHTDMFSLLHGSCGTPQANPLLHSAAGQGRYGPG